MAKTGQTLPPQVPGDVTPPGLEDTKPRAIREEEMQTVESKPTPGWQSSPLPVVEAKVPCPHIGRFAAALQADLYPLGAEWACVCGQIFVVAVNKGDKRTLRKKEDVAEDGLRANVDEPLEPDSV